VGARDDEAGSVLSGRLRAATAQPVAEGDDLGACLCFDAVDGGLNCGAEFIRLDVQSVIEFLDPDNVGQAGSEMLDFFFQHLAVIYRHAGAFMGG